MVARRALHFGEKARNEGAAQEPSAPARSRSCNTDRIDAMAVTVVDIPLPVSKALGGHLPGRHFGWLRIEFEQHGWRRSEGTNSAGEG